MLSPAARSGSELADGLFSLVLVYLACKSGLLFCVSMNLVAGMIQRGQILLIEMNMGEVRNVIELFD